MCEEAFTEKDITMAVVEIDSTASPTATSNSSSAQTQSVAKKDKMVKNQCAKPSRPTTHKMVNNAITGHLNRP